MVFSIEQLGLIGLFANTFLAASIIPFPSEPSIVLATKFFTPVNVFLVSLLGGLLGSITNYFIGLKGLHGWLVKRDRKKEEEAQKIFKKYGYTVLLIAPWIPFVGDPLIIVAGALRMNFKEFLTVAFIARIVKTGALVFFSVKLFSGF